MISDFDIEKWFMRLCVVFSVGVLIYCFGLVVGV